MNSLPLYTLPAAQYLLQTSTHQPTALNYRDEILYPFACCLWWRPAESTQVPVRLVATHKKYAEKLRILTLDNARKRLIIA